MAKIKISCKHCHKPFIVDWDVIIKKRTHIGHRKNEQKTQIDSESSEEFSLDLDCPYCNKKASYRRSEGKKYD